MEFTDDKIIITDENIISFYRDNNNLNFLSMNYILIDILKKLSINLNETLNNTMNYKIFELLNNFCRDFEVYKLEINRKDNENINILFEKLIIYKREYFEEIRNLLINNQLTNMEKIDEKINNILERNNELLISRTFNTINDIIPKNHEKLYLQVERIINQLSNDLYNKTKNLIENNSNDEKGLIEYLNNFETNFNNMMINIQQPILNYIKSSQDITKNNVDLIKEKISSQQNCQDILSNELNLSFNNFQNNLNNLMTNAQHPILTYIKSSEDRTNNNVDLIKEKMTIQQNSQDILSNEIKEFLNKYKYNSSTKGIISETQLYSILQNIFPSDEIIDCRSLTANCDYRINRHNKKKPTILFENKDYKRNVTTDEVEKFIRDIKLQKHHGIFISQNSPITYKKNYQIDIIDNLIMIYINNVNYSEEKIQLAVDIIDTLSQKLTNLDEKKENDMINSIIINKEDLDELFDEYNNFNKQKNNLLEFVKISNKQLIDTNKQLIDKIEEIHFNCINKILLKNNLIQNDLSNYNNDLKCKYCNFCGKNKASLSAHIGKCKNKKNNNETPIELEIEISKEITNKIKKSKA